MATSSATLDRSPRKNWVENAGGLPPYVRKIARAIHEKRGIPLDEAIPFAIGRIKRWAAGGDNVTAETKAKAAAAIVAWEKLKAKAKLTEATAHEYDDDALGVPTSLLLSWLEAPLTEAAGFDENLHPRDAHGHWRAKIGALGMGKRATLPGGVKVKRTESGFEITGGSAVGGRAAAASDSHPTANVTASSAVNRSLRSRARGSLGGDTSYDSLDAYEKRHGKPRADPPDYGKLTGAELRELAVAGDEQAAAALNRIMRRSAAASDAQQRAFDRARVLDNSGQVAPTPKPAKRKRLVEAHATPPKRVDLRLKDGRTVNVTVEHARQLHREGRAHADQLPGNPKGTGSGKFVEDKHPRGGKGTTAGGKFVKKGSTGTEVRAVQRRIGARVDGAFGDKTQEAVKRFQKAHGLQVDGVVGRQTLAALRGRRDAKRVKVGALTDADRAFLAGHVRGRGRQRQTQAQHDNTDGSTTTTTRTRTAGGRTKTVTTLVEAVAPSAFLDRVRELHPGELARLPDGGAVKHEATPDARPVWTSGRPSTYSPDSIGWDEQRRTPEEAVADALTRSARSTDPASLGGPMRWSGTRCTVNGKPGRFVGVNANGTPLVRFDGDDDPTPVGWPAIVPLPRLIEASRCYTPAV